MNLPFNYTTFSVTMLFYLLCSWGLDTPQSIVTWQYLLGSHLWIKEICLKIIHIR